MQPKQEKQPAYSKEVEEILKRKPSFIVRYGISILVLLFALLILIAAFIPIDDTTLLEKIFHSVFNLFPQE